MELQVPGLGCSKDFTQLLASNTLKASGFTVPCNPLVKSEKMLVCFCCLAVDIPLVNAERCSHTDFVNTYFLKEMASKLWICRLCHYMLVKIEAFRLQIKKSFELRNSKYQQPCISLINNLSIRTKISLTSVGDVKPATDPLFTAEVSVKIENVDEKSDCDDSFGYEDDLPLKSYSAALKPKSGTSSCNEVLGESSFKLIKIRKGKKKKKHKKSVTPIYVKAAAEKVEKKIKITPARTKSQHVTKKVSPETDEPIFINQQQYEGKIKTVEITRDELEKERELEREKESYTKMRYKCETCIKGYEHSYVLDTHIERHHKPLESGNPMWTCDICKCVLMNNSSYRPHYKRHFTRYVCMVCGERSDELHKTAYHYNTSHSDIDSKQMEYKCGECDFTTFTRRVYNYHKRKRHEAKLCAICDQVFTGGISYSFHMKLCHSSPAPKPAKQDTFKCAHCSRTYTNKSSYNAHIRASHAAPAPMPYCALCDKHFKHASSYKYHLKTTLLHNNGINNYVCDYCGREFRYKPPLRDHIEIQHLNIWNYKCEPCNKRFSSKNLQMKHIASVHENRQQPKNKICQFCGKGFASRKTLQCHIRRHTGERPLECEFCGDTFAHDASLYTHRKLKHKVPRKREKKQTSAPQDAKAQPNDSSSYLKDNAPYLKDGPCLGEESFYPKDGLNLKDASSYPKNGGPFLKDGFYPRDNTSYPNTYKDSEKESFSEPTSIKDSVKDRGNIFFGDIQKGAVKGCISLSMHKNSIKESVPDLSEDITENVSLAKDSMNDNVDLGNVSKDSLKDTTPSYQNVQKNMSAIEQQNLMFQTQMYNMYGSKHV